MRLRFFFVAFAGGGMFLPRRRIYGYARESGSMALLCRAVFRPVTGNGAGPGCDVSTPVETPAGRGGDGKEHRT